ncbi:MAG: hypothetical protein R6X20_18925 [Phycisphaerae bacterium]
MALRYIHDDRPSRPVTEAILRLNPKRRAAGLAEVTPQWSIAETGLVVMDGPAIDVLLDERGRPAKVLLTSGGPRWKGRTGAREYEVSGGKPNGTAAVWVGEALRLRRTETYRDNELTGLVRYFSEDGRAIASCVFRDGKPWTGRALHRDGFRMVSDYSYRNGEFHGRAIDYEDGRIERLRTFKVGVKDGLQQRYYDSGTLYKQEVYADGVIRSIRSWHRNGRLQAESTSDAEGRHHGLRRAWDEDGLLRFEEPHSHGAYHGCVRRCGHQDHWFWHGESLGGGAYGRKRFMARQAEAE